MNCYEDTTGIWRNRSFPGNSYNQISEISETDRRIIALLDKYGSCFDDEWQYCFQAKGKFVMRYPLWSNKRDISEKSSGHGKDIIHPKQQRLVVN